MNKPLEVHPRDILDISLILRFMAPLKLDYWLRHPNIRLKGRRPWDLLATGRILSVQLAALRER